MHQKHWCTSSQGNAGPWLWPSNCLQLELEVIKMVELGELKEVDGMLYPTVQTMEKMATAFDVTADQQVVS